jgi:hypothetical protein
LYNRKKKLLKCARYYHVVSFFNYPILCVSVPPRSQFRGNIEDTENVYQETSIEEVAEFFKILLTPLKIFLRVSK